MEDTYVLISGATGVLGAQLAKLFAEDGYSIILSDADDAAIELLAEDLRENHEARVLTIPIDLAERDAAEQVLKYIRNVGVAVEMLVNIPSPIAKFEDVLWRNVISLTELTRFLLPDMISRKNGKILNAAVLSPDIFPDKGRMDFAVKNYLMAFTRALVAEFEPAGITVTMATDQPVSFLNPMGPAEVTRDAAARAYEGLMKGEAIVFLRSGMDRRENIAPVRRAPRKLTVPAERVRHPSFREVGGEAKARPLKSYKKETPQEEGSSRRGRKGVSSSGRSNSRITK
jgi:uncharacterized protein